MSIRRQEDSPTPATWQFVGAYLFQDWTAHYVDEWGALDEFLEGEPTLAPQLPTEVDWILERFSTEAELRDYLVDKQGSYFLPSEDEGGFRGWLTEVAHRAREGEAGLRDRQQLRGSFPGPRPPRHASTFPDKDTAEEAIGQLLDANLAALEEWLEGGRDERIVFRGVADRVIGGSMDGFTYKATDVHGVHVVILRDASLQDGWGVHTAYPIAEPSTPALDTPALAHLMGGYFHQDWDADYPDQTAAVADFVAGSPTWAPSVGTEIDALLRDDPSEVDLADHLLALGCEFTTKAGTETYRAWLVEVARQVATGTAKDR